MDLEKKSDYQNYVKYKKKIKRCKRKDIIKDLDFTIAKDASLNISKFKKLKKYGKKLSIIIPVYNEKESLSTMIRLLKSSLKFENEVLIVYDSVDDSSVEEAKKLENELDNVRGNS